MSAIISILLVLALGIVLILLLPLVLARLGKRKVPINDRVKFICDWLCRIRIALGFLLGLALGTFAYACYAEIMTLVEGGPACLASLFWVLLFALLAAIWLVYRLIDCWRPRHDPIEGTTTSGINPRQFVLYLLLLALALFVFLALWRATGLSIREVLFVGLCARLLLAVAFLAILFLLVRAFELRYCNVDPDVTCCRRDIWIWSVILLALLLVALALMRACPDDLRQKDFDLAMVGIYWEGKYPDEIGVHLRWGFRYGLSFPEEGFELYRRPSGGGSWTLLSTEGRIHPAQVWSGPVPGPGPVWRGRGSDRLPAEIHSRYEGTNAENFQLLQTMLGRAPYDLLYYVEGRDQPFLNQADAETFAESPPSPLEPPLARWEIEPMTLLLTMALHSEVARLLGLYYIDTTADPNQEYDYRIVGYWTGVTRSYTVKRLSQARTSALVPPQFDRATAIPGPTRPLPDGTFWPTESIVGLRWAAPTATPGIDLTEADGITPVFYLPYRRDLGPTGGPALPQPDDYAVVTEPNESGDFVVIDPIAPNPQEVDGAPGQLQWPEYFAYDNWVDYRVYDYCIVGIDIFGRGSPCSNPRQVTVTDKVPPPPPINVESRIYQRSDPSVAQLLPDVRDSLFPSGSTHEFAVRVSWLWPKYLFDRVPDVKEFNIHYKFAGYESFADPANRSAWPNVSNWEGVLGSPVPITDAQPDLPLRFKDPENPGQLLVPPSAYYEATITDLPPPLIAQINADDDAPIIYGFLTVGAVDHDPFNNPGSAAPPSVSFTRDFIPPDPPAAPTLQKPPGELDKAGNAQLGVRVFNADSRYLYQFHRVRDRVLLGLDPATGTLPSQCQADSEPEMEELQSRAVENASKLAQISAVPVSPRNLLGTNWVTDYTDIVDGTISQRFFYAARAIDPAGNISALSCPSIAIESLDLMPPRAPVITKVVGEEGGISITWAENQEEDLDHYEIYRTVDPEKLNSKRKMALIFVADSVGQSVDSTLSISDASVVNIAGDRRLRWSDTSVRAGRDYHYRVVATDIGGNASKMSNPTSARSIDTTPPPAPTWDSADPVLLTSGPSGEPLVRLSWQATANEPDMQYLVQRRKGASPAWTSVTPWTANMTSYEDTDVRGDVAYHYRLRAMDAQGNRGDWSTEQSTQ